MQSDSILRFISVIGLGKLGAPLAACLAGRGFAVIGADVLPHVVACVNQAGPPVQEPGLADLIASSRARLSATTDIGAAVRATEITFVVVPTPSEADGQFSLHLILDACDEIGNVLRDKPYHLVVITSTVMPGSTGGPVKQRLEEVSGKRCGPDFGLCYNPEFIALGSAIRDMLNPDLILIGESDPHAGNLLVSVYERLCAGTPPVRRMSFVNAELTKLALNTFVTTKISFANMLAEICERLEGGDVDVVTGALGLDSRVGSAYLRGGLAYGGPCFPRDNLALQRFAEDLGVKPLLSEATDATNQLQLARIIDLVMEAKPSDDSPVAILGLAYKPDTDVVIDSPGIALARGLLARGIQVRMYDPLGLENGRAALQGEGHYAASVEECCRGAGLIAIMTPCPEFRSLQAKMTTDGMRPTVILDCWRILNAEMFGSQARYIGLGTGRLPVARERSEAARQGDPE
jgi:UDPglucose 6-dehydrogenase